MRRVASLLLGLGFACAASAQPFGASGLEFRVDTYTTDGASQPAIAYHGTSGFMIVWEGGDATDPVGVFGQRDHAVAVPSADD